MIQSTKVIGGHAPNVPSGLSILKYYGFKVMQRKVTIILPLVSSMINILAS